MQSITSRGVTLKYGNDGYVAKDAADVLKILKEKGAAILPGVLNEKECSEMNDGMWDTVEHLTSGLEKPVTRGDPESYSGVFKLIPNHGGLIQHHKWGFAQYVINVRQNPKVAEVYRLLYGDDLLVSLDGVNCSLGAVIPGRKPRGAFQGRSWLHTDQSPLDNDFKCVQSLITANEIGVGDATFRFMSDSHKYHETIAKEFKLMEKNDWFKYDDEHLERLKALGCEDTCLTCGPGDQIFWDSRLAHSGMEYIIDADCPPRSSPRPYRNVVYVCFQKKMKTTLKKRERIFDKTDSWYMRSASHWPNKMKLFGEYPRTYGQPNHLGETDSKKYWDFVPDMPDPILTEYGKKIMIGI